MPSWLERNRLTEPQVKQHLGTMASPDPDHVRRVVIGVLVTMMTAGCSEVLDVATAPRAEGPPPGLEFPECQAESYDFIGEGTLAGLGLDVATPVPPPDPDRPAMIWVTHDLLPHDVGEPGGPVEMVRMLCFRFEDGSGGSGWPVDPAWQPPGSAASAGQAEATNDDQPWTLLAVGLAVVVALGISVIAFRTGGERRQRQP
jgi:hypothetical protein